MTKAKIPVTKTPKNSLLTNWLKKADSSKPKDASSIPATPKVTPKEKDLLDKENTPDVSAKAQPKSAVQSTQKNELKFKVSVITPPVAFL